MKKSFLIFGMFLTCVFALSACQTAQVPYFPGSGGQQQNVCIPEWVKNPKDSADAVYGIGRVKLRNLQTIETADARARTQIIKTIKTKIDARFKDFMQKAGIGEDAESYQFVETVARHISSETLRGCKIIMREFCPPDEVVWSLAMLPLNQVEKIRSLIKQKLKDFMNKQALYDKFKAKKAFEEFQKELDSML